MTLFEQLQQIEERMQLSFEKKRLDTFNHLLADRLALLKKARKQADSDAFFELAQKQSAQWRVLINERLDEYRRGLAKSRAMSAYGKPSPKSGRVFTRSG